MCCENYWNPVALIVIVPRLVGGWYAARGRVLQTSTRTTDAGSERALHHPNVVSFVLGLLGLFDHVMDLLHLRLEYLLHLRRPDRRRLLDAARALQQPDEVRDAEGFTAP